MFYWSGFFIITITFITCQSGPKPCRCVFFGIGEREDDDGPAVRDEEFTGIVADARVLGTPVRLSRGSMYAASTSS